MPPKMVVVVDDEELDNGEVVMRTDQSLLSPPQTIHIQRSDVEESAGPPPAAPRRGRPSAASQNNTAPRKSYCDLCQWHYPEASLQEHIMSRGHKLENAHLEREIWTEPNNFHSSAFFKQFLVRLRRPAEPGITLWELQNHFSKVDLYEAAKKYGVEKYYTKLKEMPFKKELFHAIHKDATPERLMELMNRPEHLVPPEPVTERGALPLRSYRRSAMLSNNTKEEDDIEETNEEEQDDVKPTDTDASPKPQKVQPKSRKSAAEVASSLPLRFPACSDSGCKVPTRSIVTAALPLAQELLLRGSCIVPDCISSPRAIELLRKRLVEEYLTFQRLVHAQGCAQKLEKGPGRLAGGGVFGKVMNRYEIVLPWLMDFWYGCRLPWLPVVCEVLGADCRLVEASVVLNPPGSKVQEYLPAEKIQKELAPHVVEVFMTLIDDVGVEMSIKEDCAVPPGAAVVVDSPRVGYRSLGNTSNEALATVRLRYARACYGDAGSISALKCQWTLQPEELTHASYGLVPKTRPMSALPQKRGREE